VDFDDLILLKERSLRSARMAERGDFVGDRLLQHLLIIGATGRTPRGLSRLWEIIRFLSINIYLLRIGNAVNEPCLGA
jgi:hypothetical protein